MADFHSRLQKNNWSNPFAGRTYTDEEARGMPGVLGIVASWHPFGNASDSTASHERMVAELDRIEKETDRTNRFLGSRFLRVKRQNFENLPADAPTQVRFQALVWLGIAELNHGFEGEAIERLE